MRGRWRLAEATPEYLLFIDITTTGPGRVKYLMPRWRWVEMCKGRWPW